MDRVSGAIQSNQRTGLVVIEADGIERFALIKNGNIVAWRSDPMVEEETLGQLLLGSEQIESSQLTSALDKMHQTGQRLGEVLQSMDVMSESQIYAAIHSQLQYVFRKVLSIRTGQLLSMPSTPYQKFIHGTRLNRYLCLWINSAKRVRA